MTAPSHLRRALQAILWAGACGASMAQEVHPVAHVDLPGYLGKWYEIARLPNRFQKACIDNVTADYVRQEDGRLDVINRCRGADGRLIEATGRARIVDTSSNAQWKVRFAPAWMSWLPAVWADYWIIDLAQDGTLAAVGNPSHEYLWLLSRTPAVSGPVYDALVGRMAAQGFDTSRLVRTGQKE